MNIPNKLTMSRLVLTGIFFILVAWKDNAALMFISLGVFIIAVLTDLIDGWYARKYQMVTDFGRLADPFADKILIVGGLIFLMAKETSPVRDWMVVVIVAREFLVSGMRSFAESRGIAFGATYWGKYKALSQNIATGFVILFYGVYYITPDIDVLHIIATVLMYITTALTAISGVVYVARGKRILQLDT